MDRQDLCDSIKLHKVPFVLNPNNEWSSFPNHLKPIVERDWLEFKYFEDDCTTINPLFHNIPNTCGGIYLFCIKPNIIPNIHLYLAYIGRAKKTPHQNLRKRVSEYAKETERPKICDMKRFWSQYLYVRYLPLPDQDNDLIDELEKALIKVALPPFNEMYPKVYNQAMRSAF